MRQYYLYRVESYKYYYCFIFLCCGVAWKILKAEAKHRDNMNWIHREIHRTCIYSLATEPEWVRCIDQIRPRLTRSSLFWSSWCITPRRPALALVELLVDSEILSNFEMSLLCPTLAPGFRWFNLGWTKCTAAPWRTSTHASPSIQVACWAF
jgi:hypothetical protein